MTGSTEVKPLTMVDASALKDLSVLRFNNDLIADYLAEREVSDSDIEATKIYVTGEEWPIHDTTGLPILGRHYLGRNLIKLYSQPILKYPVTEAHKRHTSKVNPSWLNQNPSQRFSRILTHELEHLIDAVSGCDFEADRQATESQTASLLDQQKLGSLVVGGLVSGAETIIGATSQRLPILGAAVVSATAISYGYHRVAKQIRKGSHDRLPYEARARRAERNKVRPFIVAEL